MDELLSPFVAACKPRGQWRVGTEAEKFGLLAESLEPLPFVGPRSVQRVLELFVERHAWRAEREQPNGDVIALTRGSSSITLEPAGQLELSGAPFASIHETAAEFDTHWRELHGISDELGIVWLSLGFHPFATLAELPQVTKSRYAIMQRYLPTRGPRALDMMRRTCTVQANLDYDSEQDAVGKLRVGLALQPIVTAMFANSPFYEGAEGAHRCERAAVWLGMDPDRSGILPFAWERDMSFRSYVEWALDVPMFLLKRGDKVIENTRHTFRGFMKDGVQGERATRHDWELHLNTLFPEARLKKTLEMRGADAQGALLTPALPALWKGLLYDAEALTRAEALIAPLDARGVAEARPQIAQKALAARLAGRSVGDWASDVLEIARSGLERLAALEPDVPSDAAHLAPLASLIERRACPADDLLTATQTRVEFRSAVVRHTRV
jgi:glutamate--cysteine ligase